MNRVYRRPLTPLAILGYMTLNILWAVLAIVVVWAIVLFNSFIKRVNGAKAAWADIDVQLKRRYDLIPNLVETVKAYATHESTAFEKVSEARAAAMGASAPADKAQAENQLSGTLKSLFAIAEAYPDLKANANFLDLQKTLSEIEDNIQAARRFYNGSVRDLNIALQSFPGNMIAGIFGFHAMDLFELSSNDAGASEPVAVNF